MLAAGRIKRVLIVAPLSILGVWEDEFKRFADFPYQLIVLNGTIQKKIQQLRFLTGEGVHVVVVNYESAWRMEKELANWHPDLSLLMKDIKLKLITLQFQRQCTGWACLPGIGSC
uniref:SNF2-related protein n=1 Tax=Thermoanaerobacter thermocopriae TaxID=29350 RepID=UPI001C44D7D8